MKKGFLLLITSGVLMVLSSSCNNSDQPASVQEDFYSDVEFRMDKVIEPQFSVKQVSVVDYGARGDGQTLNTEAIKMAIDDLAANGGGTLVIPRGIWLTGPIILKSNIRIHAVDGALVLFSTDKSLYPLIETVFEGRNTFRCTSPIYGRDLENIALTGKGIYDGSGEVWRHIKKEKMTASQWKDLVKSGGIVNEDGKTWFPSESYKKGFDISEMNVPVQYNSVQEFEGIRDFLRPVMVSLVSCRKVLIDGPGFQNSPAWCIHPLLCEDLTVRNITVKNPWYSQNGDGIDIESCRNTLLYNSNFDVGDDAICIKSGKDEEGRRRGKPTENLVIRNCIVYHGHGGVTIGSEMSGGVLNVSVAGCTFMGTDVGLRFKSNRGRGGVVENVWFTDISMTNIPAAAVSFNLYYGGSSALEMLEEEDLSSTDSGKILPVTEETPCFRNIHIKNLICRGALQAIELQGLPELNLEKVTLEDLDIQSENGLIFMDANNITVSNLRLITKNKPLLTFMNSRNVDIKNFILPGQADSIFTVGGSRSGNIKIETVSGDGTRKVYGF